jgi:gas vesicle protein
MTTQKDDLSVIPAILAIVGGTLLGVLAGLLFAPQSGRESRSRLGKYIRSSCHKMRHPTSNSASAAADGTSKLTATLSRVVQESQDALRDVQEKLNNSGANSKASKKG